MISTYTAGSRDPAVFSPNIIIMKKLGTSFFVAFLGLLTTGQAQVLSIQMEDATNITGARTPLIVKGIVGNAVRFDGYSQYFSQAADLSGCTSDVTFSLWTALETYPMMNIDIDREEYTSLAGNIDESAKTGMSFDVSNRGNYQFKCYVNNSVIVVQGTGTLPKYQWNNLVATITIPASGRGSVSLYLNGQKVASGTTARNASFSSGSAAFLVGKNTNDVRQDKFLLNTINGIVDNINIYNTTWSDSEVASAYTAELPAEAPQLAFPAEYWANELLRPKFHGMPSHAWTNESHGMTWFDGKYHVFFQKNGNGPYMCRLHWGHIVSENLYNWTEVKTAIDPAENYDVKGCWSGCVVEDEKIFGSYPGIIYTGVDYAKAMISFASPTDASLIDWTKASNNPRINGRPAGLSDDFRDPYFFRTEHGAYIIVGSSKGGIGCCTLHKYNEGTGNWSNDGTLFFQGTNVSSHGTFWEMPNVTPMGDGRYLFTVTPQNTGLGVRTLYWVGKIDEAGKFQPIDGTWPRTVELSGMTKDGYGLLSPTIYQKDGKTIALGIVPDKVASSVNYDLGWAHCYSLPREWSLDANGLLQQKPYSGLTGMRKAEDAYSKANFQLNGTEALSTVAGRQVEVCATFQATGAAFGIDVLKSGSGQARISLSGSTLTVDLTSLARINNDGHSFGGRYESALPTPIEVGSEVKLHVFLDGSILDIFINDTYAASIRVFANDADATSVALFAEQNTQVVSAQAWNLDPSQGSGQAIEEVRADSKPCPSGIVYRIEDDHSLHLYRGEVRIF